MPACKLLGAALLVASLLVAAGASGAPPPAPFCPGVYADDLRTLSGDARTFDRGPEAVFSYCARNTATYECLSYALDGGVRRERRKAVLHGTAFPYRRQGNDTFLLTNDHVAEWPTVTDPQHPVEGIPAGCKKISETLVLVDDEHDSYTRDDVPVARVVTDPQLDVAILKTQANLHVMPWKVGRSAALRERNAVEVRGFPLGAFRATNAGKVISALDHDDFGEWDHDDFVVDALLSAGNSGSPVLAVSCATGEYELVGIYHAGYTAGSALNVVVGIDQVRDMMMTLKRSPPARKEETLTLDGSARASVQEALGPGKEMFFPFGSSVALVRGQLDGSLLFAVFSRDFPLNAEPVFVAEDLPADAATFGARGRIWFGSSRGLKPYERADLDADGQLETARILEALRSDAFRHAAFRRANIPDVSSREAAERLRRMSKVISRTTAARGDLLTTIADLSDKLAPPAGQAGLAFSVVAYPAPLTRPPKPERPGTPAIASELGVSSPSAAPK